MGIKQRIENFLRNRFKGYEEIEIVNDDVYEDDFYRSLDKELTELAKADTPAAAQEAGEIFKQLTEIESGLKEQQPENLTQQLEAVESCKEKCRDIVEKQVSKKEENYVKKLEEQFLEDSAENPHITLQPTKLQPTQNANAPEADRKTFVENEQKDFRELPLHEDIPKEKLYYMVAPEKISGVIPESRMQDEAMKTLMLERMVKAAIEKYQAKTLSDLNFSGRPPELEKQMKDIAVRELAKIQAENAPALEPQLNNNEQAKHDQQIELS